MTRNGIYIEEETIPMIAVIFEVSPKDEEKEIKSNSIKTNKKASGAHVRC
jgi:hypothetical protein